MLVIMDKFTIIKLKEQNKSDREVAKITGHDRKTIAKYWNSYLYDLSELSQVKLLNKDLNEIQEKIISKPKYDSTNRKKRKYNDGIDKDLNYILEKEKTKDLKLKDHKQKID